MGEYARRTSDSERIKIGTCEDMYYLRYDQRHHVTPESGNVDPVADAAEIRFRFPWPDEDHMAPGAFEDYDRAIRVDGLTAGDGVTHHSIQFSAPGGYLVNLPCPESSAYTIADGSRMLTAHPAIRVHLNGYNGAVHLVQQRFRPGIGLVPVLRCGGCGTLWRMEDRSEIEELAMWLRSTGDQRNRAHMGDGTFWHTIADRVLAGLTETDPYAPSTSRRTTTEARS